MYYCSGFVVVAFSLVDFLAFSLDRSIENKQKICNLIFISSFILAKAGQRCGFLTATFFGEFASAPSTQSAQYWNLNT